MGRFTRAPLLAVLLLTGCSRQAATPGCSTPRLQVAADEPITDPLAPNPAPSTPAHRILNGAKAEARRGVRYDASYRHIPYPGGDIPADRGACTDVIIRALRHAGYDLQRLIHEDVLRARSCYPRVRTAGRVDPNIDHRRVQNQIVFFRRHGLSLPTGVTGPDAATWQPGDFVFWRFANGRDHCGVVADTRNARGLPLVIHNLGTATLEDCLTAWKITGHFRFPRPESHRTSR